MAAVHMGANAGDQEVIHHIKLLQQLSDDAAWQSNKCSVRESATT